MKNAFQLTAIKRNTISVPVRNLLKKELFNESDNVLDYGCGHGTDIKFLNSLGFNLNGYDKYNPEYNNEIDLSVYSVIISQYVFNVISDPKERQDLIDVLRKSGKKVFITVRADQTAVKPSWVYNADNGGYFTSTGSFQRFYTDNESLKEFGEVRILKANKSFVQFQLL